MAAAMPILEPTGNGLGSDCFALVWSEKDQKLYGLNASGVEDGGRTGLTSITTSVLFALMLLFTPLALMVPGVATGPVLTIIGFQMLSSMRSIDYDDKTECLSSSPLPWSS